jgi:hypothetical protein
MNPRKGGMRACLACTIGKAKQKNVKKKSEGIKRKESGGRMYLDISTVKYKKGEPKIMNKKLENHGRRKYQFENLSFLCKERWNG